jgi:glycyl-tRNA synthetase beta chain
VPAARDAVVEIGVEELPSSYIAPALDALRSATDAALRQNRLSVQRVEVGGTPRRLIAWLYGLAERQETVVERVMGPAARVAFDAEGKPTKAASGFARGQGVDVGALMIVETEKGQYVAADVTRPSDLAAGVLARVLPEIVEALPFPKSMTWAPEAGRFARPIRWVLALHGGDLVPLALAGLTADRVTYGHRLLAPQAVQVPEAGALAETLESVHVLADPARRRARVAELAEAEAQKLGGRLIRDDELLDIVTQMVEWPEAVAGRFDEEFLILPREVIVTALREHQRYFAIEDASGALVPGFVCIANGVSSDAVRAGHERVLRARLADARFHWHNDLRAHPETKVPSLGGVVWIEGLGTLLDRTNRLRTLARELASACGANPEAVDRAALLSKVDLISDMLQDGKEYTSLQGVIGGAYANASGESARVVAAIRDQYRPSFAGDAIPETGEGAALALADKLDLIAGCFLGGRIPTGAEDPFGVRRAALGMLRILLERGISLRLDHALARALALFPAGGSIGVEKARQDALAFLASRLEGVLRASGVDHDLVDATLAVGAADPLDALKRAEALARGRAGEDLALAAQCARRAANFLKDVADRDDAGVSASALTEPTERALLAALERAEREADAALARSDHDALLRAALALKTPVDEFFTAVLVLDPDPGVRARRVALVRRVDGVFRRGWDFGRLQGEARVAASA